MKTLSLSEEYYTFQKLYGNYFTTQMFGDFLSYKQLRYMHSFQEIAEELSSLEQISYDW